MPKNRYEDEIEEILQNADPDDEILSKDKEAQEIGCDEDQAGQPFRPRFASPRDDGAVPPHGLFGPAPDGRRRENQAHGPEHHNRQADASADAVLLAPVRGVGVAPRGLRRNFGGLGA